MDEHNVGIRKKTSFVRKGFHEIIFNTMKEFQASNITGKIRVMRQWNVCGACAKRFFLFHLYFMYFKLNVDVVMYTSILHKTFLSSANQYNIENVYWKAKLWITVCIHTKGKNSWPEDAIHMILWFRLCCTIFLDWTELLRINITFVGLTKIAYSVNLNARIVACVQIHIVRNLHFDHFFENLFHTPKFDHSLYRSLSPSYPFFSLHFRTLFVSAIWSEWRFVLYVIVPSPEPTQITKISSSLFVY